MTTKDTCPLCDGYGFRIYDGESVNRPCECRIAKERELKEEMVARLFIDAGIPPKLKNATLDQLDTKDASVRRMVEAAKGYFDGLPFLTLIGANGTGKSHVAASLANILLASDAERIRLGEKRDAMPSVYWAYLPYFLEQLQKGMFTKDADGKYTGQGYYDLMERAYGVDLLILDDLGLCQDSDFAGLQQDKVIGRRYDREMRTIVTTNLLLERVKTEKPEDKVPMLPPRLASRLGDRAIGRVHMLTAEDYRKNKRG